MKRVMMVVALLIMLLTGAIAFGAGQGNERPPVVRTASRTMSTRPLHRIPELPTVVYDVRKLERKMLPNRLGSDSSSSDSSVLQDSSLGTNAPATMANFEGIGNRNGVLPPDTDGDVGPNHYVQIINLSFAIYDKSGNVLYGPVNNNTLWSGFGGPCENSNDGDPIVLYDQLADRWMISQFALPNYPIGGPYYECIAISQTPDPTGAWYLYEFLISNSKLNDYPKFGVWPNGYFMAINQFSCQIFGCSWAGQGAVAFERARMLTGDPGARMVYFDLEQVDSSLGGMLPADWDGATQPPSGAPNPFVQIDDDAWGNWPDRLQIWELDVDWGNPGSATFSAAQYLNTAAFDANMCDYSRNCIPQPGGTAVDAISDRLMFRLQYRNFGSHQAMVVNHTVDANGADRAGIRWYELRNTGSGWSIFQQATYSPDSDHRWMGSMAMNSAGDIALGYSVSSTSLSPSIRVTGRLDGDPLGQMTQGEGVIVNGSGYQTHSSGRWGDYSAMTVDPVDDCTFWYTQEYVNSVTSAGWKTRVGSFKLRNCGAVDNPPDVTLTSPAEGTAVAGTIDVTANASDDNGVTQVDFFVDGISIGVDTSAPYSVTWDSTSVGDGSHTVSATATDTIGQTASDSNNITVDNIVANTMHVGDLEGTSTNVRNSWQAEVTINVHDSDHGNVAGATVSGSWSGDTAGSSSCVTSSAGACTVTSQLMLKKDTAYAIFTVDSVSNGLTYVPGDNHDPNGNSNDSAIRVNKDGSTENPGAPPNQPPTATFTSSCDDATRFCQFDATGSTDPDGMIVSYDWDFGDGTNGSGLTTDHTYDSDGAYSVVLTVTDDGGATGSDTQTVTVGTVSTPVVISCDPNSASQGSRLVVAVLGENFQSGASVDFGERIVVQSVNLISSTQLDVQIKVHNQAPLGNRTVTVTNPDGNSGTLPGCFSVN